MLVVMENHATSDQIDRVVHVIEEMGYQARPMPGSQRTTVGLVGNDGRVDSSRIEALPGVAEVIHVSRPYKQVSREWKQENTLVRLAPGVVDLVLDPAPPAAARQHEGPAPAARVPRSPRWSAVAAAR